MVRTHAATNCLTEVLIAKAEGWAQACSTEGPLAGMPVSFKDTVGFEGEDSCIGYSAWVGRPMQKDAAIVRLLKDAGAVPFVKTNVPITLLSFESANDVFGTTTNFAAVQEIGTNGKPVAGTGSGSATTSVAAGKAASSSSAALETTSVSVAATTAANTAKATASTTASAATSTSSAAAGGNSGDEQSSLSEFSSFEKKRKTDQRSNFFS